MGPMQYKSVEEIKALRVAVDALIQQVEAEGTHDAGPVTSDTARLYDTAESQARIHLIDAKMWLGKMLEGLGNPFPKELADKANVQ